MNMTSSDILIQAIKEFESYRDVAYICPGGVCTIGYGHTKDVKWGDTCTKEEAEAMLLADLATFENYVNGLYLDLTQGQFDALVDFAFNLGTAALAGSTLLLRIRARESDDRIQAEFRRWVYSNGKKLNGLVKRREWEAQRWAE